MLENQVICTVIHCHANAGRIVAGNNSHFESLTRNFALESIACVVGIAEGPVENSNRLQGTAGIIGRGRIHSGFSDAGGRDCRFI